MKTKLTKEDHLLVIDINNPPLCKCGCGKPVTLNSNGRNRWNAYLFNHHLVINRHLCKCGCGNRVDKIYQIYLPGHRTDKPKPLCLCGCGKNVYHLSSRYLPGHYELKNYQDRLSIRDSKLKEKQSIVYEDNKKDIENKLKIEQYLEKVKQEKLNQPIVQSSINVPPCKCGCNRPVNFNKQFKRWNDYAKHGCCNRHQFYLKNPQRFDPRLFNKDIPYLCKCGCGTMTVWSLKANRWTEYIRGHSSRTKIIPFCKCGCGKKTLNKYSIYLPGHKPSKINEPVSLCKCGCGKNVLRKTSIYLPGHKSEELKKEKERLIQEVNFNAPLCKCGCGKKVKFKRLNPIEYNLFITGHNHKLLEVKEKARIRCAEYHCPNIGKLEFEIFPKLQEVSPYKILCLDNQKKVKCGYHLDGYIEELNLVIEIDENWHNGTVSQIKDPIRVENIYTELKCEFFRIKEKEWKDNSEVVIKEFHDKIIEISNSKNL